MRRASGPRRAGIVLGFLVVILLAVTGAWAAPTTPEQAKTVVTNWLGSDAQPLGAAMGQQVTEVQTFADGSGNPLYYVVYLNPAGFVLVSGEDLVEPIIGFLPNGTYDPSPINPLGALVSRDIPGRVQEARLMEAQAMIMGAPLESTSPQAAAQAKWALLQNYSPLMGAGSGISSVSDLRVAPLIQTRWSQTTVDNSPTGGACYNYFTPPYQPGYPGNYPSGCVATCMGQLMYFWQYPLAGVGTGVYSITVDDGPIQWVNLRGSDGYGNPYLWSSMVLDPLHIPTTDAQRQAIGNLLHDAGAAVNMSYKNDGSGAYMVNAAAALKNTFKFNNAIDGSNSPNSIIRNTMINPNLDAQYPVLLGIIKTSASSGHAVVCDGYGYYFQTLYHHLNMGWSGSSDAWYNLPIIYTDYTQGPTTDDFNSVTDVVYNVYVSGSGEIISGRVTDTSGNPISGVTVTATVVGTGTTYTAATNAQGIYALVKVPSSSIFIIAATKTGFIFSPQTAVTGVSTNSSTTTGNVWGVNFTSGSMLSWALDNFQLSFSTSGNAGWFAETTNWYYGGAAAQSGAISNGQSSSLQTTVTGPGTLSFYWSSSSYVFYNRLTFYLDGVSQDNISGVVDWTQKTLKIPAGTHTVTWTYSKTTSASSPLYSDCVWVDKVSYLHRVSPGIYQLLLQ